MDKFESTVVRLKRSYENTGSVVYLTTKGRQLERNLTNVNKRLPGACNRSPGSELLSITTQLHSGGHLGGIARLPDTILEEDHPMTIPSKFGSN